MKKQLGFTATELSVVLFFTVLAIGGAVGWVWNVIKIVAMLADPITGMFIFRCIGIFVAPLGAVLGYF